MPHVRELTENGVCLLLIDHPPVNALSVRGGLVGELTEAVARAAAAPGIAKLVFASGRSIFSAGADIGDFADGPEGPRLLRALFDAIEASPKPVFAFTAGDAMGGGVELLLACHYRLAARTARFSLPEITLGLLPGGGGTQRMPRLVGIDRARDLMLSGRTIDASTALDWGLVDAILDTTDASQLIAHVRTLGEMPPRPTMARVVATDTYTPQRGGPVVGTAEARAAIERCLQAASHDGREGLRLEAQEFDALAGTASSKGLRHVFFGRREVMNVPGLPRAQPVASVAIVGAGLMGRGIALACLAAELPVLLIDTSADALAKAVDQTGETIGRDVEKGRLTSAASAERLARLRTSTALADVDASDLVIEAAFESLEVKRSIFAELERHAKPDAQLATNTSTIDIDAIATVLDRPERCIGLHFFSPANVMQLLEIVRGDVTSDAEISRALAFARQIRKVGVVARSCDGFIGNRMFEEYLRQAYLLLEEGASPTQVDGALEAWGMAMGPLKVMDLAGQDIGCAIRKRRAVEQPDRPYSRIPDLICELGRFGQKTDAGFYLYPDGRTARHDPEIDALIERHSADIGVVRRSITDEEIVDRCILALVNEGGWILDEGVALRPVDIDMVFVFGYGFSAERGGPMFYAEQRDMSRVAERIAQLADQPNGWAWRPSAFLREAAGHAIDRTAAEPGA